jgi:TIR domain
MCFSITHIVPITYGVLCPLYAKFRLDDYKLYDWDLEEIPDYAVVSQIPEPGIFFASKPISVDGEIASQLIITKHRLQNESQQFKDLLNGIASRFVPDLPTQHDIFLAYSADDEDAAVELYQQLKDANLSCFMAKVGIGAGSLWTDVLREAICSCQVGVLFLTPKSIDKSWVMCEAGALWALNKTIVPAWRHIDLNCLPGIITKHQARRIETNKEQQDLIVELKKLLYD